MGRGWADIHMVKGVFVRFGFDAIRISQIQRQVKNKATGTPHEVYYIQLSLASIGSSAVCCRCGVLYTYIGVGLSALLVSTCRAMREPQFVERATGLTPRLFSYVLVRGFRQQRSRLTFNLLTK